MVAVLEARWPILSSFLSTITVSSRSTTNAEMPRCPASGSVFAQTVHQSAGPPLVMKHFWPLRTYLSPLRTARVRMPETSEPASGSVRQNDASFGASVSIPRYLRLVSSEPASPTGALARPFAPSDVWIPEQPHESSSSMMQPSRYEASGPP